RLLARGEDDAGALFRQPDSGDFPDAGGGAGDDDGLALHMHLNSSWPGPPNRAKARSEGKLHVRAIHTVSPVERFRKITPIRIHSCNQIQLPDARIFLDPGLAPDRIGSGCKRFKICGTLDAVTLGKTFDQAFAMLINTARQVVDHAGVQRSTWAAGKDVD